MSSISFYKYYSGPTNINLNEVLRIMKSETLLPDQYDVSYLGLSFQKVGKSAIFIIDPAFSFGKRIIQDAWIIKYDKTFTGYGNLKFSPQADAGLSYNINQVLQQYGYDNELPIKSFESIYMKLVKLDTINYLVGTVFQPNQPYLRLKYIKSSDITFSIGNEVRIPYNTIEYSSNDNETDDTSSEITFTSTGPTAGQVFLKATGRYVIKASYNIVFSGVLANPAYAEIRIKLNGIMIDNSKCVHKSLDGIVNGDINIFSIIYIDESHLLDSQNDKAILEIFGVNLDTGYNVLLAQSSTTKLTISFIG